MPSKSTLLTGSKTQTAVYWARPTVAGDGDRDFPDPVELTRAVRWEETAELFVDQNGHERTSAAMVHVLQDLQIGGYLWLGTLAELDSSAQSPLEIKTAYEIGAFEKIPSIKGTFFTRHAFLAPRM